MLANIRKNTLLALGRACDTDISAELNYSVAEITLFHRLYKVRHDPFGFHGVLHILGIESKPAANSDTVRIRNKRGLFVKIAKQKIGNLSAYTRKGKQIIHVVGYDTAKIINKSTARLFYIRCLCSV